MMYACEYYVATETHTYTIIVNATDHKWLKDNPRRGEAIVTKLYSTLTDQVCCCCRWTDPQYSWVRSCVVKQSVESRIINVRLQLMHRDALEENLIN